MADLAVRIFDVMHNEHRLSDHERLLLYVAGLLHEVGMYVASSSHHKHSYYLIANSEVFGLRRADLMVVALAARYHRRSPPKRTHPEYMVLPREKRMIVSKLSAILRVADALDRGHAQQVRDVRFELSPNELIIYVSGAARPDAGAAGPGRQGRPLRRRLRPEGAVGRSRRHAGRFAPDGIAAIGSTA